jgi:hypothetical protein
MNCHPERSERPALLCGASTGWEERETAFDVEAKKSRSFSPLRMTKLKENDAAGHGSLQSEF